MAAHVTKEEAAVILAALTAYLTKPPPTPPKPLLSRKDLEEAVKPILDEYEDRIRSEVLAEVKDFFEGLRRRIDKLERRVLILAKRGEGRKPGVEAAKAVRVRSPWSLAGRHEAWTRLALTQRAAKTASLWSLAGRMEIMEKG